MGSAVLDPKYKDLYERLPLGFDFSSRDWFIEPMKSGKLHVTDIYQSLFTDKLIVSVSAPVTDEHDEISGIIGVDIQLDELLRRAEALEEQQNDNGN